MIDRTARWLVAPLLLCASGLGPLAAAAATAETPASVAAGLAHTALTDDWGYRFLQSLTTEIGPRLAGTEAEVRAAEWAEAKLEAAGMEVHLEKFPMTAWERGIETAAIVKPAPQRLVLTTLGGSVATPPAGIEGEAVVFRTYGALLAAAPGSLAGKIAVVTEHMVRTESGAGYGAANPIRRAGPAEAARRGAVAYLHRSLGTDNHRLPHTGALDYVEGVARIPAAALANPDADQLERLAALGPVTVHVTLTPSENPSAQSITVVGEIKGREKPDEIVLIGAHLDSWDLGTGAIDDGAGDAIVSEVGKLIAALPRHPRRTVRVVLFGAEELDFSGPAYAKAHIEEASRIVAAGETDFGARKVYAVQLPLGAAESSFGQTVGQILPSLNALLNHEPARRGGSDIEGLRLAGVPMLSLSQNGMDYFDIHHSADDTFDKVDPAELAQDAAVWAAITYLTAETEVDFRAVAKAAPQ
ncbi:MAG: peptidase family protein [Rhodospirillales bacterium]|nr:peptidase family protein [Rhodospirillales bacterium]